MAKTLGRPSIFRGKARRIQGLLTKIGSAAFEQARQDLADLYVQIHGCEASGVSDGDTAEYLARGSVETRKYLEHAKR